MQLFSGACAWFDFCSLCYGVLGPLVVTGYLPLLLILSVSFLMQRSFNRSVIPDSAFTITLTAAVPPPSNEWLPWRHIDTYICCLYSYNRLVRGATTSSGAPTCGAGPWNGTCGINSIATSFKRYYRINGYRSSNANNTVSTTARMQLFAGSVWFTNAFIGCTTSFHRYT